MTAKHSATGNPYVFLHGSVPASFLRGTKDRWRKTGSIAVMDSTQFSHPEKPIEALNRLLLFEESMIERYDSAIRENDKSESEGFLVDIMDQHDNSAEQIRARIDELKGTPVAGTKTDEAIDLMARESAKRLPSDSPLQALLGDEQRGEREYDEALRDRQLDADSQALVSEELLPRLRRNQKLLKTELGVAKE